MGTLEELHKIDEGDLETLIALYLRQRDSELRPLIATGMNPEGKPIKCPIDAVLYISGPNEKLVHVATTTFEEAGINRKWLGGKKGKDYEPGDIKKASDEFDKMGANGTATRKLYLGWNRALGNDVELYRHVFKRCRDLGMEVEIIEASQLVTFLDHDPEGQYLRQELLGIDAFRLSERLLRQIGIRSLLYHKHLFGSANIEIPREAVGDLERALKQSSASLIGLVGPSGAGKSTILRQEGDRINLTESICLWVPAEDFITHISPAALLRRALLRFYPALNERAGDDALEIASRIPGGLVLLVDDVNRLSSPTEALDVIRALARFDIQIQTGQQRQPRLQFMIPLWPNRSVEQLSEHEQDWLIVNLDFYSAGERQQLANTQPNLDGTVLIPLLNSLGGDPFLCDLAISSAVAHTLSTATTRNSILRTIIEDVLKKATAEAAASHKVATQDQFASAIDDVIDFMLVTDHPEPSWQAVSAYLGEHSAQLLMILGNKNGLGWVEQGLDGSHWRWKHDRLRDALVGRRLADMITRAMERSKLNEITTVLETPGTAEAWAWTFIFTDTSFHTHLIRVLAEHQPLALAEGLALVEFRNDDSTADALTESLRHVLDGYSLSSERFVELPLWPVLYRLTRTSHPLVLSVTAELEQNAHVDFGRFRNGDTRSGLRLMERFFGPMGTNFPTLERAAEGYRQVNSNRRTQVAKELREESHNRASLTPILGLCGYLQWSELTDVAWNAWKSANEHEKQEALLGLIWALSRCAPEGDQHRLEEALQRARLWEDEDEKTDRNDRYDNFSEPLHFMLTERITEAASKTIAKVASEHRDLASSMIYVLRGIDTPATTEAYVRLTAAFGGSMWDHIDATENHDEAGQPHREKIPIRQTSRDRLWEMIQSDETENVRKVSLWLWKRFTAPEDLQKLQSIPEADGLFDEVLQVRLSLRDRTATPLLLDRIKVRPGAWLPYCYLLYGEPGVADALFGNLETALESDILERQYVERLPQNLPPEGVRRLVAEKRELLTRTPRMWNSLWRSDVPEALELVGQLLTDANPRDLEHFARGSGNSYRVTIRMLSAVAALLHRFSETSRYWLITTFINAGLAKSLEAHGIECKVPGVKGQLRCWLSEADGRKILNAAKRAVPFGPEKVKQSPYYFDFERQSKMVGFDSPKILREWIEASPEPNNVVVAGTLLARIGTGDDAQWWQQLQPDNGTAAFETWKDTLYILRRRRWQKHD